MDLQDTRTAETVPPETTTPEEAAPIEDEPKLNQGTTPRGKPHQRSRRPGPRHVASRQPSAAPQRGRSGPATLQPPSWVSAWPCPPHR